MNAKQLNKRQVRYAKILFAKGQIDRELYGLLLIGWATYYPQYNEVYDVSRGRFVPLLK